MGIIRKCNGKIRIILDKLYGKVRIVFNYLPHTTFPWIITTNYLYDYIRIIVGHLNSKIGVFCDNLNPTVQWNAFATTGATVNGFSGSKHWKQCEYKTRD